MLPDKIRMKSSLTYATARIFQSVSGTCRGRSTPSVMVKPFMYHSRDQSTGLVLPEKIRWPSELKSATPDDAPIRVRHFDGVKSVRLVGLLVSHSHPSSKQRFDPSASFCQIK